MALNDVAIDLGEEEAARVHDVQRRTSEFAEEVRRAHEEHVRFGAGYGDREEERGSS